MIVTRKTTSLGGKSRGQHLNSDDSDDIDMCMEVGGGNECAQLKYLPRRNRATV
jgi:hypothetical protein